MAFFELSPTYGRDYPNKKMVIKAFESGRDFNGDYHHGFRLTSKSDFKRGDTVMLRYKRLTQVAVVKIK